ncbi:EamA-like transporter family protein [Aquisphaera giovannonii]|uniref:EamA-like transporter family protein n=1 Tax=Aquisphaera giovannonii TaxID=406548 RepID=A0A5B9W3R0_9BACT|nr:DMT family transporter [Aquisphaera giovannonii]QEH34725.1 EamA-like transporter family protein [Aquisphaera giovannonii]
MRPTTRGRAFVLAAGILWSLGGLLGKSVAMDPLGIAFYRSLFAGLALLPLVSPRRWAFRPSMVPLGIAFGSMIGFYLAAIKLTTAANAIYLQYTATFWVIPLGMLFLGEHPSRRALWGVALAMVGIAVIVARGYDGRPDEWRGVALGLASGASFAVIATGMRGLREHDPTWLSVVYNLLGAATLAAWMTVPGRGIPTPTAGQAAFLAVFGVVQMAIPYVLFARGLRDVSAAEAALIALVEPILGPIWVALVLGELPAPATVVGGMFLLLGILCRYAPSGRVAGAGPPTAGPPASAGSRPRR